MIVTSRPSAAATSKVLLVLLGLRTISRAAASNTKHSAVSGAIRPGIEVPTVPAGSGNSRWSMPASQAKRYSPRVSAPIRAASRPHSRVKPEKTLVRPGPSVAGGEGNSAIPIRMKPRAVFGFTETQPGSTLFSAPISSAQPASTIAPVTTARAAANVSTRYADSELPSRERGAAGLARTLRPCASESGTSPAAGIRIEPATRSAARICLSSFCSRRSAMTRQCARFVSSTRNSNADT